MASKEEKSLTVNDCIKEQYKQAKTLKKEYKKLGWNIKVKRKKDKRRFYNYKSLLKARGTLFNIIITERKKRRGSQDEQSSKRDI